MFKSGIEDRLRHQSGEINKWLYDHFSMTMLPEKQDFGSIAEDLPDVRYPRVGSVRSGFLKLWPTILSNSLCTLKRQNASQMTLGEALKVTAFESVRNFVRGP